MKQELIYYERSDEKGPKVSSFIKVNIFLIIHV